jgi:uncharacterized membrane protein YfcA
MTAAPLCVYIKRRPHTLTAHEAANFSLAGFIVGLLVGMTGIGGGSLMTPLLIPLFGVQPATAVGTDLIYAAATKSGGTIVHGFSHSVDWRIVRRLAAKIVYENIGPAASILTAFGCSAG